MPPDLRPHAWLRLTLTPGVGRRSLRRGLERFGSPITLAGASERELRAALAEPAAQALARGPDKGAMDAAEYWLGVPGNHLIAIDDDRFPAALLAAPDPPLVLYATGRTDLLASDAVAVVGSRSATAQGIRNAETFAAALSDRGLTIVSGLALGIDAAAHRGGLSARGSTIAVVGTGADRIYPARNGTLHERIRAEGLIVSEFPLGTPPLAAHFPRRNRIISGLSRGCLVIEAALSSGSLITARLAADQGREVFAIPGSIHSPVSRGCHALIREGAKLVESAEDVLEELRLVAPRRRSEAPPTAGDPLLEILGHEPMTLDLLCTLAGLTPDVVCAMLLALELDGKIEALAGGRYQRLA